MSYSFHPGLPFLFIFLSGSFSNLRRGDSPVGGVGVSRKREQRDQRAKCPRFVWRSTIRKISHHVRDVHISEIRGNVEFPRLPKLTLVEKYANQGLFCLGLRPASAEERKSKPMKLGRTVAPCSPRQRGESGAPLAAGDVLSSLQPRTEAGFPRNAQSLGALPLESPDLYHFAEIRRLQQLPAISFPALFFFGRAA